MPHNCKVKNENLHVPQCIEDQIVVRIPYWKPGHDGVDWNHNQYSQYEHLEAWLLEILKMHEDRESRNQQGTHHAPGGQIINV